jgi:hypothetical protein
MMNLIYLNKIRLLLTLEHGKMGECMSCDDKSGVVVINQSTASSERCNVDATSTSKNNEVGMDDNEMKEEMSRFSGKCGRHYMSMKSGFQKFSLKCSNIMPIFGS